MSEASNQSGIKKKSKKRRKGKGGKVTAVDGASGDQNKMPKQVTQRDDQVITTSKCNRCKGIYRQMIVESDSSKSLQQFATWMCPSCVQEMKSEGEVHATNSHSLLSSRGSIGVKDSFTSLGTSGCNCSACVAKRENAVSPEVERDTHITQTYWMEIRHVVRCIYRENMSLTNQNNKSTIGSEKMHMIVRKLCSKDPHQFFQRLETLAREYLLEVKVRLLEQLSCGFNSPQLAIEFIQMLLEEYSLLCNALPALLYLLKPLEECDYVQKLGMTIELMNKNIFRELIFAESFMNSNLPLIIAQLRLASLADHLHQTTADELNQRYITLDHEMEEISQIWKSAKAHLNNQQLEDKQSHFEKIKADGESFKRQVKVLHSNRAKVTDDGTKSKHDDQRCDSQCSTTSKTISIDKTYSNCNGVFNSKPIQKLLQSQMNENEVLQSKQAEEWSRHLFKCIKPIGNPEFSLSGDIATHTITLHLDMTQLDLAESKPCCTRNDLTKYQRLGLSVEEIMEVAMKLSSLRHLGLNVKIEDLFDDEGFSLSDINEMVVSAKLSSRNEVYLMDSDEEQDRIDELTNEYSHDSLSMNEEIDLQKAKERILQRHSLLVNGGRTRQQDFLQGLTMKIRFMKTLSVDDLDKNFIAADGKVIFNSCDQVQMKLTQLELSSVCLSTSCNSIGDNLGLDVDASHLDLLAMNQLSASHKTPDDYVFVHTDSHHEFMDLLLEKRKQLESTIISSEQDRRNLQTLAQISLPKRDIEIENGPKIDAKACSSSLPRYQVREQQESTTSNPVVTRPNEPHGSKKEVKKYFKPFLYSKDSQPCQCSACVGAMATIITTTYKSSSDPQADSATIQCSLSAHLGLKTKPQPTSTSSDKDLLLCSKNAHLNNTSTSSSTTPLSKEGLWQNWMSTSGSAQLENASHIANGHHHHNGAHCCHYGENYDMDCDRFKACAHHDSTSGCKSCSISSVCHHSTSNKEEGNETSSSGSANGISNGSDEVPRRYCPCCYCELFGHNGPPTAPTSHNYTKRRDIMRQKLEEKKKKRKEHTASKSALKDEHQTSVEELLAYIEGGDSEEGDLSIISKASKRQRKKQKKVQVSPLLDSVEGNFDATGHCLFHRVHHESIIEDCNEIESVVDDTTGVHTSSVLTHKSPSVLERRKRSGNASHEKMSVESVDIDEYDDELEEFKKFCFADAPVGPRKKIGVSLNMHDIMSKLSS